MYAYHFAYILFKFSKKFSPFQIPRESVSIMEKTHTGLHKIDNVVDITSQKILLDMSQNCKNKVFDIFQDFMHYFMHFYVKELKLKYFSTFNTIIACI